MITALAPEPPCLKRSTPYVPYVGLTQGRWQHLMDPILHFVRGGRSTKNYIILSFRATRGQETRKHEFCSTRRKKQNCEEAFSAKIYDAEVTRQNVSRGIHCTAVAAGTAAVYCTPHLINCDERSEEARSVVLSRRYQLRICWI